VNDRRGGVTEPVHAWTFQSREPRDPNGFSIAQWRIVVVETRVERPESREPFGPLALADSFKIPHSEIRLPHSKDSELVACIFGHAVGCPRWIHHQTYVDFVDFFETSNEVL